MSDRSNNRGNAEKGAAPLPEHLARWPGLYVREGDGIVEASAEDQAVAQGYPSFAEKGPIVDGARLTLMTKKKTYKASEEVRILHVAETVVPGRHVAVMGPKKVHGEHVDGDLASTSPPSSHDDVAQRIYSGAVLPSPAVDYNYDITTYRFDSPGVHEIYWKPESLRSNVLKIEVVD